ncbi:MAG: chorismate mutase [Bryobacteraceae bacterium]
MTKAEAEQLLADSRKRIDELDLQLRDLLNRRTKIVEDVLRAKDALHMQVYEAGREEAVLNKITEGNPGPLDDASFRRLFGTLMQVMREFQVARRELQHPPVAPSDDPTSETFE